MEGIRRDYNMSDKDNNNGNGSGTGVTVRTKPRTKKPSMYKVLLLNDDYTPMEFVVHILERFFGKSTEEANRIMLHVHRRSRGPAGEIHRGYAKARYLFLLKGALKGMLMAAGELHDLIDL